MAGPIPGGRLKLARLADQLDRVSRVDLVVLLTVLTLLLYHNHFWYLSGPLTALMVAGSSGPRCGRAPGTGSRRCSSSRWRA